MGQEIVIHDHNAHEHMTFRGYDGLERSRGLKPRDFSAKPHGSMKAAPAFDLPLIPESEWADRLAAQIQASARCSDIRNRGMNGKSIPSRDQDGVGYCWCHSGVSAHLVVRAQMGEPYLDLSPFSIGCMVKGFRDEGGDGSEGIEFEAGRGVATSQFWPQRSMSRSNDNPNTWDNAAKHKYIQWRDLDPNQMKAQLVTCLLMGIPVVSDFNWWSHSVCSIDLVSISPFQTRIWNSWGDSWSENGTGILTGNKAVPDGAWAAIGVGPSIS